MMLTKLGDIFVEWDVKPDSKLSRYIREITDTLNEFGRVIIEKEKLQDKEGE